jgi:hypothetical protein
MPCHGALAPEPGGYSWAGVQFEAVPVTVTVVAHSPLVGPEHAPPHRNGVVSYPYSYVPGGTHVST